MQHKTGLYIFNPEHDMALASFSPYYKMPGEIIRMRDDLCFLPAWYAPEESYIYISDKDLISVFNNQVEPLKYFPEDRFVDYVVDTKIFPWGWNPSLVHSLSLYGFPGYGCPDKAGLERIRYLSSRQRCMETLECLAGIGGICGNAYQCNDTSDIKKILNTHSRVVFKSPWSSSGRGLVFVSVSVLSDNVENRLLRVVRSQGCVMAEPVYDKVVDFAMEFYSDNNGGISFIGYSLFETDCHGNYKHNVLASDMAIEQKLSCYISISLLSDVREIVIKKLESIISGDYTGYLGIDMMICSEKGEYLLHPCVEINLRMNMGVVSRVFFDRYVNKSSIGRFAIEHHFSDGEALAFHNDFTSKYPLVKDDEGKIVSGYLPLVPITGNTRYCAYIFCNERQVVL